jgi:hypothetical protein
MAKEVVNIDLRETFKGRYRMRRTGPTSKFNVVTSIPPPVVQREAESHGLSMDEFVKRFEAVVHYGGFKGVYITFEEPGAPTRETIAEPPEKKGGDEWWYPRAKNENV